MHGPDPSARFPFPGARHTAFIKNVVTRHTIEAGDYSYYHDPEGPEHFEERCVLYHFDFIGDRLIIGRFCAFATGVQFIMNGANHAMTGFSTYPFSIFGGGWELGFDPATWTAGLRGDTRIGNDVWIGREARILPGVTIGDGAIIGTRAVVGQDVPPYAIAVGNPARIVRQRFAPAVIDRLLVIAWWNWPVERISRNLDAIRGADLQVLERAAA
ncbi:CatB-related O-acetyltransferase [Polymorphum gilvum]|uniref:Acetyltransferase, trimeric LpxA-like protein n=1 Tax=Polymorphum gilvum (strain LMG 25793 / CGMCC 1.9160 / SL003B-26A1) TaxID=991905 RepID=F2J1Z5_POLGS|nr:CatB-related O-acetyltransferase [Polymorphum gilvum]ADZ72056.1 Acetyltransferase, trimeric LpxA-like protein [Polymorphum gilvum SL003B-26A1]